MFPLSVKPYFGGRELCEAFVSSAEKVASRAIFCNPSKNGCAVFRRRDRSPLRALAVRRNARLAHCAA